MSMQDNQQVARNPGGWSVLDYPLGAVAILLIVAMTLLTCIDVVARYIFNAPIDGAFELTQLLLAALIFTALPLTTAAGEHVDVELFAVAAGPRFQPVFRAISGVVSAAVLLVLSWRLWAHAGRLLEDGAVTNSLGLPFAPVGYLAAASCAISGVIVILKLIPLVRNKSGKSS